MDPIQYPKVTIGEKEYTVRFRCGDVVRLKAQGVDFAAMKDGFADKVEDAMKLLSAGISHEASISAESLGDMIDLAELPTISAVIGEALRKASPQETPSTKPTLQ